MSTANDRSIIDTVVVPHFDDFHLHVRDGDVLKDTVAAASEHTEYAIIMPNTQPPITTAQLAIEYRRRILAASKNAAFTPLMTLYLTADTTPQHIVDAVQSEVVYAVKLYPLGATTNSHHGVRIADPAVMARLHETFAAMAKLSLPLLIHGENNDDAIDIFDREAKFIDGTLPALTSGHPQLRIVLEHITTTEAVDYILQHRSDRIAATITAHHLLINRNALFAGGLNAHNYCLPIVKAETHRQSLLRAIRSGSPHFFAGTDSAPHAAHRKLNEGCAGCYTAFAALQLYAMAFDSVGCLDGLAAFVGVNGRCWYGLGDVPQSRSLTLKRSQWTVPATLPFGQDIVVPFMAKSNIEWQIVEK